MSSMRQLKNQNTATCHVYRQRRSLVIGIPKMVAVNLSVEAGDIVAFSWVDGKKFARFEVAIKGVQKYVSGNRSGYWANKNRGVCQS